MLILGDWCINVNEYNARGVIIAISLHGGLHFITGIMGGMKNLKNVSWNSEKDIAFEVATITFEQTHDVPSTDSLSPRQRVKIVRIASLK